MEQQVENIFNEIAITSPLFALFVFIYTTLLYIFKDNIVNFFKRTIDQIKARISPKPSRVLREIKFTGLKNHDVFNLIELIRRECHIQKFYTDKKLDHTKTKMFKDFMDFKLNSISEHFMLLTKEGAKCDTPMELKVLILNTVRYITEEYMDNTKLHFIARGINMRDANYVIDVFEAWRLPTIKAVGERVNSIFSSPFHKDNYSRMLAFFEIISIAVELIPRDGVASFDEINGKFKEIKTY